MYTVFMRKYNIYYHHPSPHASTAKWMSLYAVCVAIGCRSNLSALSKLFYFYFLLIFFSYFSCTVYFRVKSTCFVCAMGSDVKAIAGQSYF